MRYFAYGSNLSTRQMAERCPSASPVGVAVLAGHRLAFTRYSPSWGGGVADVVPDGEQSVWGLLYELDPPDLAALDAYEGGYRRVRLSVTAEGGASSRPWSYQVADRARFVAPTPEYLGVIRAGAERLGFPAAYQRALEAVPTTGG